MSKEVFESSTIICRGGLNSNRNWLEINEQNVGLATDLINFEPSLFGGYRRINGFSYLENMDTGFVDSAGAEGKILGVFFYDDQILCARKQQGSNTYEFYKWVPGSSWSKYTTGLTFVSTGVNKIRSATFNFDGTEKIIFVDGVNEPTIFDGTTWVSVLSGATGANYANAGGAQVLAAPNYVTVFQNHIFIYGDSTYPHVLAHSAPREEYDWTSAGGAGQINTGMFGMQICPYREELFVFGDIKLKKVIVESSSFALKDVANNIGCVASDTVLEINGDLIFLSNDGVRTVKATERANDIELGAISKQIQEDVRSYTVSGYNSSDVSGVLVSSKSQFRYFFSPSGVDEDASEGLLGGLKNYQGSLIWEFGKLRGIKASCAASGRIGTPADEYVVHGTHDGKVMRQEVGNSFNSSNIFAQYSTPFLDFGVPSLRKTLHEVLLFTRPEGSVSINVEVTYDWGVTSAINPLDYSMETTGNPSLYGVAIYGSGSYGGVTVPTMVTNIQGSGKSARLTFSTSSTEAPYSIQGIVIKYQVHGFK